MSGGRNTKELMVYAPSKTDALAKLEAEFTTYTRQRGIAEFTWKVQPQALRGEITKEWRAYGRIEFSK